MLTDAERELIAAAVGGELSPAEDAAFRMLVAESVSAAALYQQLYRHRQRIQSLRRLSAPPSLAPAVLARIQTYPVTVSTTFRRPARRGRWVPYAVAASLMLCVSAGTFWAVSRSGADSEASAQRAALPQLTEPEVAVVIPADAGPRSAAIPPPSPVPGNVGPPLLAAVPRSSAPELAPAPRPTGGGDLVGSSFVDQAVTLGTIHARLPFLAAVPDLDRPAVRARLADDLRPDVPVRVDLFVHDPLRAAEVFQTAARSKGILLTIDAATQDRLKKKLPATWVVYTEALSAEDVSQFLAQLAVTTRSSDPTPVFATAHVVPAGAGDHKELRELLGTDPGTWNRAKPVGASKPLTTGTADEVTSAVLKKDRVGNKPALFLSQQHLNGYPVPGTPKDVKTYLDRRGDRKSGTVPLFIVIRPAV